MAANERKERGIRRVDLAYAEVASSELARDVNRDVILEIVRSRQPVSRADLSRLSGLQPSTVSAIAEELLRDKWIAEGGTATRPRGRRPMMLSLNPELVMLVADVRPMQAILAVVDLNGRFLAREVLPLATGAEKALQAMVDRMQEMRARQSSHTFVGVGISLPGRVDPATQQLVHAPNLKWTGFDIKGFVQKQTGLPVEIDNAANACLLSELWFGRMDGIRDAALVTFAEGVGASILSNGHLIAGRGGLAGEFGHIPIEPEGLPCACGFKGCWETIASTRAALRYFAEAAPDQPKITYTELLHRAAEGQPAAVQAISEQARGIGRGLRFITASLSPEAIVIDGDIVSAWNIAGPIIEKAAQQSVLSGVAPRVIPSTDGELGRLRGAAAVLLQRRSGTNKPED
ncbi:MAG: ROK family protein [Acidobacteria bacterium]|nr:ROK family protein [Acidobacteriota bacterium]